MHAGIQSALQSSQDQVLQSSSLQYSIGELNEFFFSLRLVLKLGVPYANKLWIEFWVILLEFKA